MFAFGTIDEPGWGGGRAGVDDCSIAAPMNPRWFAFAKMAPDSREIGYALGLHVGALIWWVHREVLQRRSLYGERPGVS